MSETPAFLAERLRVEGEKFYAIFEEMTDDQWQTEVYTEGTTWTIRHVLAHFVTSEMGFLKLFANILEGGVGAAEDFSIDRYNARQQEKTKDQTPDMLLGQFKSVRAKMVTWVSNLKEEDLQTEGRHPFLGLVSLSDMIKMVYRHNQIHYRDIRMVINNESSK